MKRPDSKLVLRFTVAFLAFATAALAVVFLFQRNYAVNTALSGLTERSDALAARMEVLVEAEGRRLLAIDIAETGVPPDTVLVSGVELIWGRQVGEKNLYTAVVREDRTKFLVGVEREPSVYLFSELPMEPVVDAMREVCPASRGRVYITGVDGTPVLLWPERQRTDVGNQKFRRTNDALDAIARGKSSAGKYKDLDDRAAVGAYRASESFHGGVVVEQSSRIALKSVRGVQPWHLSGALLAIALAALLLSMIIPRFKFTGDLMRLLRYSKRYLWIVGLAILCMLAFAGGNMFRLTLMKTVFDDVLLGKGSGAIKALKWVMYWFAVIIVVMAVAEWFKVYLSAYVTQRIVNDIRCSVAAHLITLDVKYFDRQRSGELMSRLSNDVQETRKSLGLIFGEFFQEPLMLLGALGAAFITNWRLTLMVAFGIPLLIFPIYRLGRLVKKYSKRRQVQQGVVTEVMLQSVTGVRVVKSFQREEHESEKLRKASNRLLHQSVRVARTNAFSRSIVDLMNSIGGMMILAFGGYMVIYGTAGATAGDLATLSVIMAQMYKPVKVLTKTYNKIQESLAGAERIFEIMDEQPRIVDHAGALDFDRPREEIAFEGVSFAYDEKPVLKDVSFRVKAGEVVGLVGETGAGKSTVTDLVARFYDPTEGRVTIDGVDIRDLKVTRLRRSVSIVTQDAFLFNATVEENIRYGTPEATFEQIKAAAEAAYILGEIEEMEDGFDTMVGDRGARLSGGQRQRITIARGILKDAPVLILDEATSALDSQTEAKVQEALEKLMAGRTTFVIAHRLSTISHADRILVFKEGALLEQGTHEELMERKGVYQSLHQLQFATTNGS